MIVIPSGMFKRTGCGKESEADGAAQVVESRVCGDCEGGNNVRSLLVEMVKGPVHCKAFNQQVPEGKMRRAGMILVVAFVLACMPASAQEKGSTKRIELQHKLTYFQKEHMKESEESLLQAIQSNSIELQQSGIQAVRELEQLDPVYPFTLLVGPLSEKLKDENADGTVRMLAALALDELHSDAGDDVIRSVAQVSADTGLKNLCNALLVRSWLESPH